MVLVDPAKLASYWLTFKNENIKTIDQTIEAGVEQMKKTGRQVFYTKQ